MICATAPLLPCRVSIARAMDALVDRLNEIDGNPDFEAEPDYAEILGDAFVEPWQMNRFQRRARQRRGT